MKISILIFVVSLFSQLYVSNKLAVKGKEMVELEYRKEALLKEISELELAQTNYTSLSYIESRAIDLGFVENNRYVSTIKPITATAAATSY